MKKFNLYELLGLIIGDGYIYYDEIKGIYFLEITGNASEDLEYFDRVSNFISVETGKTPKIKVKKEKKGSSLKLYFNSKDYLIFLIFQIGLVYRNKTFNAKIPKKYLSWTFMKDIIRGLFEADGSLYFSRGRRQQHYYPRLEIKSSSKYIIKQVISSLKSQDFSVVLRIILNICYGKS